MEQREGIKHAARTRQFEKRRNRPLEEKWFEYRTSCAVFSEGINSKKGPFARSLLVIVSHSHVSLTRDVAGYTWVMDAEGDERKYVDF